MKTFLEFVNVQGITQNLQVGDKVRYIPLHANKDRNHPDCEVGIVTSWNQRAVFVRYEKQHPEANGQATDSDSLELVHSMSHELHLQIAEQQKDL